MHFQCSNVCTGSMQKNDGMVSETPRKEKNREKDCCRSGAGLNTGRTWGFMAVLGFLAPFLEFRETSGNYMQSPSSQASQVAALQDSQPDPPAASQQSTEPIS